MRPGKNDARNNFVDMCARFCMDVDELLAKTNYGEEMCVCACVRVCVHAREKESRIENDIHQCNVCGQLKY